MHLNEVVDDAVEQLSDAVALGALTDAACNLANEVALLHVFRAQDVEHLAVFGSIEARCGGFAAASLAHDPRNISHGLGIFHDEGHLLKGFCLDHLPVGGGRGAEL